MKKKFKFKGITIRLYTDPMKFAKMPIKPFGDIPKGAKFGGVTNDKGEHKISTGFVSIKDNSMWLFVGAFYDSAFEEILETVSHELGHLITGGFKKNPPQKPRYDNKHEQKADHYQDFVMDSYKLTQKVYNICFQHG